MARRQGLAGRAIDKMRNLLNYRTSGHARPAADHFFVLADGARDQVIAADEHRTARSTSPISRGPARS
jgi:hypothetical protein